MPYIEQWKRSPFITAISNLKIETEGELNYAMTLLAVEFVKQHGESYSTYNSVRGAFACAADEFYRRVVVPYENAKKYSNGDVYGGRY